MVQDVDKAELVFKQEGNNTTLYLELDGRPIAKRYPGKSWIVLEPGYHVHGGEPGAMQSRRITIEYRPEEAGPQ
jgi:hypothetical protein